MRLRTHAGFRLFWTASTVSGFGSQVTTLAVQVLIVTTLAGSAADVGLVNGARWLPYLLVGVVVGALADRVRRKPLLVGTDLSRAVLLCAVPLLAWSGTLSIPLLAALMALFGLLSLVNDAAHQSFLPRLLPRTSLTRANARLEQSAAAANTSGPAVAGGLVSWLGAPAAVLVDAVSYLASGLLTARVAVTDPPPPVRGPLGREIREGLVWVYGHRMLRPLSLITHGWTLFAAVLGAVYVPYGIRELGFSSLGLGLTLACAGVGGLLGSGLSERLGGRPGRAVPGAWLLDAVGIAVLASTPAGSLLVAGAGHFLNGFGLGLSSPIELSYRQAVTPDRLQARTNATMRSLNPDRGGDRRPARRAARRLGRLPGRALGVRQRHCLCRYCTPGVPIPHSTLKLITLPPTMFFGRNKWSRYIGVSTCSFRLRPVNVVAPRRSLRRRKVAPVLEHRKEARPMSKHDQLPLRSPYKSMPIEELARLRGVNPVTNLEDMACDVFESDEEMEDFIAYTYYCRRSGHA